jgi:hypothetical protein
MCDDDNVPLFTEETFRRNKANLAATATVKAATGMSVGRRRRRSIVRWEGTSKARSEPPCHGHVGRQRWHSIVRREGTRKAASLHATGMSVDEDDARHGHVGRRGWRSANENVEINTYIVVDLTYRADSETANERDLILMSAAWGACRIPYMREDQVMAHELTYHNLHPSPLQDSESHDMPGYSADSQLMLCGKVPVSPTGTKGSYEPYIQVICKIYATNMQWICNNMQ